MCIYFNKINKENGINGQSIDLILADDGYEPKNTVVNTREFLFDQKIHAIFGSMGTPTAHAIKPILDRHRIPFLMPFTGATSWVRRNNTKSAGFKTTAI